MENDEQVRKALVIDEHGKAVTDIEFVVVEKDIITLITSSGAAVLAKTVGWVSPEENKVGNKIVSQLAKAVVKE